MPQMGPEINSKKRILFIITQSEMGGAQKFLFNLADRISKNYEIKVMTGSDGGSELINKLRNANINADTLRFLKREIDPVNDIKAAFEIRDLIDQFKPDDLFLISSKAGFIGSFAAEYLIHTVRPKVIYRIGGWTFNDPWPAWKKKLWIMLEQKSAHWKDIIILNNRKDFHQSQELNIKPKEKTVLIYNGLDTYKTEPIPREDARLKLFEKLLKKSGRIFQTETIIGTIANLYPTKGIDTLISAAEYLKNNEKVSFFIIGDGSERNYLESRIKSLGLEKKVFLLGQLPDASQYLPSFDLFVLPSVKEGFPWALIEAMASRVPVIATRVGAVPEIIVNGKNGFIVEPSNPAALADKIKEVLASDHLQKEFAIQGHQTVLFNFSEDKMIKETEAVL
jgi:glycosyltransferase involved in cell wall biosynthesis